jgi:hypothetical protein
MAVPTNHGITRLLVAWNNGDATALNQPRQLWDTSGSIPDREGGH